MRKPSAALPWLLCAVILFLLSVAPAIVEASGNPPSQAPDQKETPSVRDIVEVTGVYNFQYKDSNDKDFFDKIPEKRQAGLDDIVVIEVSKLEALLRASKCQPPYNVQNCHSQEIALFINGRAIRGLKPESGAPTLVKTPPGATKNQGFLDGRLRYHLRRSTPECTADCKEHWADLLGLSTNFSTWSWERPVEVSVGLVDDYPVATQVTSSAAGDHQFHIIRVRSYRLPFWVIFVVACLILLYLLAKKTDLLRDRAPVLWRQSKPYSLSAFQAAWWFGLILT